MKKTLLAALAFIAVAAVSCSNPTTDETTTQTPEAVATENATTPVAEPTGAETQLAMPSSETPVTINQAPAGAPAPGAAKTYPPGTKLNPPHGEPGHDCAIPVGEPLPNNNAPGGIQVQSPPPANLQNPNAGTPTISTSPAPTSIMTAPAQTAAPAPGKTAPGMNPPHGEPGHDCAIPVGAPLKK